MANRALYYLYRNLHTGTFSLKHKGKVISRPSTIVMYDCVFKVSEAGRQRVLEDQAKNVHAMVGCERYSEYDLNLDVSSLREVYYDPYTSSNFHFKDTREPVFSTELVIGLNNKIYCK